MLIFRRLASELIARDSVHITTYDMQVLIPLCPLTLGRSSWMDDDGDEYGTPVRELIAQTHFLGHLHVLHRFSDDVGL